MGRTTHSHLRRMSLGRQQTPLHFYHQVVQWEETGSAVFMSDLSPITGAISEQSLLANGNTRRRRLTRPLATTSLCTSGKRYGSGWGDGFCSSYRVFHQRGGFVPRQPRQNPSRPPRAERIPRFVFMKRLLRDIFPECRNILASRKCCKAMEQLCRLDVKSCHAVWSGLRNVTFLKKKKKFPPCFSHESTDTSFKSPLGGKKIEGNRWWLGRGGGQVRFRGLLNAFACTRFHTWCKTKAQWLWQRPENLLFFWVHPGSQLSHSASHFDQDVEKKRRRRRRKKKAPFAEL